MTAEPIYDTLGVGYADYRRPDPLWAARIDAALGDAETVLNVGAGTGSYEPIGRRVTALEPSSVMIEQRPAGAAPAVRGTADALPFPDRCFDASLALLTVHHWPDAATGLVELQRVSTRQVVFTWDAEVAASTLWFARDYLPESLAHEAAIATFDTIAALIEPDHVEVLPVPADCSDGVFGAYWRRPEAYLDPGVRAAISAIAKLPDFLVDRAVSRLRSDLETGLWEAEYRDLLALDELDLGYRLIIASSEAVAR